MKNCEESENLSYLQTKKLACQSMDAGRTRDSQVSTASSKLLLVPLPHSQRPMRRGLPGTCIALGCITGEEHWAKGPWVFYNEQWASLIFAPEGHIIFITEQWTNLLLALEGELVSLFPGCLLPKESWKQPGVEAVFLLVRCSETEEAQTLLTLFGEIYVRDASSWQDVCLCCQRPGSSKLFNFF